MLPKLAVLAADANSQVDWRIVLEVFEALRAYRNIVKPKQAYRLGPNRHCWHNVEKLVAEHGGELVMGLGIVRDLELGFAQKNDFAKVALNSHAVWCSDGDCFETTKERQGQEFLITAAPRCNYTIEFFDYDSKKTLEKLDEILPIASHEGVPYRNLFVSLRSQKLLGEKSPD